MFADPEEQNHQCRLGCRRTWLKFSLGVTELQHEAAIKPRRVPSSLLLLPVPHVSGTQQFAQPLAAGTK